MPVYTYRCDNCGIQFDQHQKFSDAALTKCPECGKKSLKKVLYPVGIVFKGSGFYATDHRSPSGGGVYSSTSKSDEQTSEPKTEVKAEKPKPAAAKESTPAAGSEPK